MNCKWCGDEVEKHLIIGHPHTANPKGEHIMILWHKGRGNACFPQAKITSGMYNYKATASSDEELEAIVKIL